MEYYRGKYKHKENKTRTALIHIIQKGIHKNKVVFNPPKNSYSRVPTQSYHRAVDTGSLTKVDVTGFVVHSAV